ncbi:MAG: transglycosylase family protein [Actinobacteria bacterium]|nr:transglycosylase family protein [Actinomycetota bacterium]
MDRLQKERLRKGLGIAFLLLTLPTIAYASAEVSSGPALTPRPSRPPLVSYTPPVGDPLVEQTLRNELTLARHREHLIEEAQRKHRAWVRKQRHIEWVREQQAKKAAAAARAAELRQRAAAEAAAQEAAEEATQATVQQPSYTPAPVPASSGADWYAIAACESGGNWSINTGNGFWGGLQFTPQTWFAYGGGPFSGSGPFPYSATTQIAVAERVLDGQGPNAWPNCFQWL